MADGKMLNAVTPREGKDGKTRWHQVGIAFQNEKGTTIYLDSYPVPDAEGKVKIMLFERQEREQDQPKPQRGKKDVVDDEIPF